MVPGRKLAQEGESRLAGERPGLAGSERMLKRATLMKLELSCAAIMKTPGVMGTEPHRYPKAGQRGQCRFDPLYFVNWHAGGRMTGLGPAQAGRSTPYRL